MPDLSPDMITFKPEDHHKAMLDDLMTVLYKHESEVSANDALAIFAHMTGRLTAVQCGVPEERIMPMVLGNIAGGREKVLAVLAHRSAEAGNA